jgi:hypothetical protein
MSKRQEEFLDHFARLGVFSKVQALMGSGGETESEVNVIRSQDDVAVASCSRTLKGNLKLFLLSLSIGNYIIALLPSQNLYRRRQRHQSHRKTRRKSFPEKLITGTTGASAEVAIAFTSGQIPLPLNSQMAPTAGSDSSWMENWRQCTRVEVPRMEMTVQVRRDLSGFSEAKSRL